MGGGNWYDRLFGAGPVGLVASLALLGVAWLLEHLGLGAAIFSGRGGLLPLLIVAVLATTAVVVASLRSLPVDKRGRELTTAGPFRYVRHPLYAAGLSILAPALALFLNDWIYLGWAVALHPLWHLLIRREERICRGYFGAAYDDYARQTGRFLPRLIVKS